MTNDEIAKTIDHTNLKPTTRPGDIKKLCEEALEYGFAGVCLHPHFVPLAKQILDDSDVKIVSVAGFPLGQNCLDTKLFEIQSLIEDGCDEVDVVINRSFVMEGRWDMVSHEIESFRAVCQDRVLKVIFETCELNEDQIRKLCVICAEYEVDFVKTSTGFGSAGANLEVVQTMFEACDGRCQVKAAGGVRSREDAISMIQAGASRLGTSAGITIMTSY